MGRVTEPRKARNGKSRRPRLRRKATSSHPMDASEDMTIFPGSTSSARIHRPSARESGDLADASSRVVRERQLREGDKPQAVVHVDEESRVFVVPEKPANSEVTPEESVEGRDTANGKSTEGNTHRTQYRDNVLTKLEWIGKVARQKKEERFNNLLSHIKVPLLREAYSRLSKKAASGVDGQTWEQYGEDLDARLLDLQGRVHRGSYHPQPVRRVYIPKADGRARPLGIPTLEDKLVQQAARMILEPIYEAQFMGFSYGFRPGRSQHKALDALYVVLGGKANWVLDADIRSFYDTIDHGWMQKFLEHRISDRRMVYLLMKWMRAGVMEDGELRDVTEGTPQGGVISPLLANIYLHYAFDLWVQQWRKQSARGEVRVVRYADDFVMGFQDEEDARAMLSALAERFAKFGLTLHPEKTRVIRFGRFARRDCGLDGHARPQTFDFLGFTHFSAVSWSGKFRVGRRTSRKKRVAKLASLSEEIDQRKHFSVTEQFAWLSSVIRGHVRYYGVPGNFSALASFRYRVRECWHRALQRRSQRARWTREKRDAFDARFRLPPARIHHPSPLTRFACP